MSRLSAATRAQGATALTAISADGFIGRRQVGALCQALAGEERQWFRDTLVEIDTRIRAMPRTYETDGAGDDSIAQLHYFTGGMDWWITERDAESEQLQAFGLADLGHGTELGYISLAEILRHGAELDLHWQPRPLREVKRSRRAA